MSIYRRRYDRNEIIKLKFDSIFRKNEEDKFLLSKKDDMTEEDMIVFFNFIVLCSVSSFRGKRIDENTCDKIIDKADGYLFALEDGLFNVDQLYLKFKEIMENDFFVIDWDYKVIYEVENDYNK